MYTSVNNLVIIGLIMSLWGCNKPGPSNNAKTTSDQKSVKLEVVAELEISPGNVAISQTGRIFMSVHPMRASDLQLVEVFDNNEYQAYPSAAYQSTPSAKSDSTFDAPLGIFVDKKNRLWVIDAGLNLGKTRLFGFDLKTGAELFRFDIPEQFAPATSFVQDLAVDEQNEWAYLADFGDPGIIAVNIETGDYRKFTDNTMLAEDIDIVIDNNVLHFQGSPARIGINPITLSDDRNMLYYGAMSGTKWYELPTKPFRENASDQELKQAIKITGPKPPSDGVATGLGRHFFTNLQDGAIDVLDASGNLKTLIKDPKIVWPDNARLGPDGWLYLAVNQLHKAPAFTGGAEQAQLPYYLLRVKVD